MAIPDVRERPGDLPICPVVVGRPAQMSGRGREALPKLQGWSEGSPGYLELVGRSFRMSKTGLEAPSGCPGVVRRPSWMSVRPSRIFDSGRETFPNVREWSGGPPGCP